MITQREINRRKNRFERKGKDERLNSPDIVNMTSQRKSRRSKVFKIIQGSGSGGGYYECKEQIIDKDKWGNADPFIDKNDKIVVVYAFSSGESGSLSNGDYLIGFMMWDDETNRRYVGFSPKYAWWHA